MATETVDKIVLSDWESKLCAVLRARFPGIMLQTVEEKRVLNSLISVLQFMGLHGMGKRELIVWSQVSMAAIDIADGKTTDAPAAEFFKTVKAFKENKGTKEKPTAATLVLCDAGHLLKAPNNLRLIRETFAEIRGTSRTIIFTGLPFEVPEEIGPDVTMLTFELPEEKQLIATLEPIVKKYKAIPAYSKVNIDVSVVTKFARACTGLTDTEARGLLGLAISRFEAFDMRAVNMALEEKAQVVKRSNVLEYRVCTGGLDKVGGLQNVKQWIKEQDDILKDPDEAHANGLSLSKGLMLIGVPGTGKTLLATMLAAHWNLSLLIFDVAKAFGSLVGQSEANIDQVIRYAKACRPCVVFIDEIEKALGGGGGELDGGTSARVKGKLMSWLQDKPEDVFVVATANDVTKFESEPAFIRAGRFDLISFVDLPDMRSRLEILGIQYRNAYEKAVNKFGKTTLAQTIAPDVLVEVAKASKGYSGAELETVMQRALRYRFKTKPRPATPTTEMLLDALGTVRPLSVTMKEPIEKLRAWVKDGRAIPAGATLEDDANDEKDFKEHGLPMIFTEPEK